MLVKSFRSRPSSPLPFIFVSVLVGTLVGFVLATIGYGTKNQFLTSRQLLTAQTVLGEAVISVDKNPLQSSPDESQEAEPHLEPHLKYLQDMVAKTGGFYARDYSVWLGWNNIRYIIETAVLHGRILNRTTIIPSFAYARACEFDIQTCAAYATMVNRNDATHSDEWRDLPIEKQMAWRIPISAMFNLTRLQQSHSVITTEDYFRLHDISDVVESSDGQWNLDAYHVRDSQGVVNPSVHVVENEWYDSGYMIRVDRIPQDMRIRGGWTTQLGGDASRDEVGRWSKSKPHSPLYHALTEELPLEKPILDWKTVKRVVEDGERITSTSSVEDIGEVLQENGFEVLYTFGTIGFGLLKDMVFPICEAVPRHQIRGLYEDLHGIQERVLLVRGELHLWRRPGSVHFTSAESRTRYSQTVLYDIRMTDDILALAEVISNRMFALNDGRLWMAAHMRRGDFRKYGWVMENDFAAHLARIRDRLGKGREELVSMHGGQASTYDVPGVHPDSSLVRLEPPNPDDKFYIATDERDPGNLQYLRDRGGILITDLLTTEDRREMGWPIVFTDVLSLVEQSIMSRAAYFYGHTMSSVAGGVINLRAGLGKDPRTALLD